MGVNNRFKDATVRYLVRPILYTAVLTTLAFGGSKLIPSARADPPKPVPEQTSRRPAGPTEKQPPTGPREEAPPGSKEAEPPKAPLDSELAKLKKVSLSEMQRLAKETCEKYECRYDNDTKDDYRWTGSVVNIHIPNGTFKPDGTPHYGLMSVLITIDSASKELIDNGLLVMALGKPAGIAPFTNLARLYKIATGDELKYVRLAVRQHNDEDGPHMEVSVIPVEKPNDEIKTGIPVQVDAYYVDDFKSPKLYGQGFRLTTTNFAQR